MATAKDLAYCILERYVNNKDICSRARVLWSIYLIDWWSCLHKNCRASCIEWVYDMKRGPYNQDALEEIERAQEFRLEEKKSLDSNVIVKVCYINDENYIPQLTEAEREALEVVVVTTQGMSWTIFNAFVRSTYPLQVLNRGDKINIMELAQKYRIGKYSSNDVSMEIEH